MVRPCPRKWPREAARLGLRALALTDHDGLYGTARMAEAAAELGVATIIGAELSLGLSGPQNGVADPEGTHLLVLARQEEGYHRLAAAITSGQLAGGEKGRPVYDLEELAARAEGHWMILTGCRKGVVRQALQVGPAQAGIELDRLVSLFGPSNVVVELFDHGNPLDSSHNDTLAALLSSVVFVWWRRRTRTTRAPRSTTCTQRLPPCEHAEASTNWMAGSPHPGRLTSDRAQRWPRGLCGIPVRLRTPW